MCDLPFQDMARDNAGYPAACGEGGVGHQPHKTDPAAAIDDLDATLASFAAKMHGRILIGLVNVSRRSAIDAYR
jgi:hypothetical protein